MLDGWIEDALDCLVEINQSQDKEPLNPDDVIAATNAVFSLIKSYAFRNEFPGATLMVADSDIQYAKIYLPAVDDPYSDRLNIRKETYIDPLGWKFEIPEYWDAEDEEPVVWDKPVESSFSHHDQPLDCSKTQAILDRLRQKNAYYGKLLEDDPEEQIKHLEALNDLSYEMHENSGYTDLDEMTQMGKYLGGNVNKVFGHRYVPLSETNDYIVAKNWLGPVGIVCLSSYGQKGDADYRNPRKAPS